MESSSGLLELVARDTGSGPCDDSVTLTFERRQRTRARVRLDGGGEAAILLPRGEVLRGGERLRSRCGRVVEMRAADENLSHVAVADAAALARAAYHLGNRHVAVQVGPGWLRYAHDHVLDDLVRGLGLPVRTCSAPFEPEAGAYAGHSHAHEHVHEHVHAHGHDHDGS